MAKFWKILPSGNPTLLLRAEDVVKDKRVEVAKEILSPLHLGGEQAGFIRLRPQTAGELPRLDMTGGEFCLNATRAFGALLAWQGLLPLTHEQELTYRGMIEVSGANDPILVEVMLPKEDSSTCAVWATLHFDELPKANIQDGLALVRLPGICHIVLAEGEIPQDFVLDEVCAQLRMKFGLECEEAVGCMWLQHDAKGPMLHPAVWVRDTQSLCLESACGSGTLACALWLADQTKETKFAIRQPSGDTLNVEIGKSEHGFDVRVGGPVRLVAQGEVMIEEALSASCVLNRNR